MKKLPLILLSLLLLASCHRGGLPDGVLDEAAMTDFLVDAYLLEGANAIETQYRHDRLTEKAQQGYDSILSVHSLTREQVERSFDYYSHHLDLYQAIQDSVVARLETPQTDL